MTPGTPFIYYGEEIGLADHWGNGVYEDYDHRGPMWWSNTDHSLTPNPPEKMQWPHQASLYNNGVEEQLKDKDSLLRHYIRVINLKKRWPWLAYGHKIQALYGSDSRLSACRVVNPENAGQSLVIVHSTSPYDDISINFAALGFRKTDGVLFRGLSAFSSDVYEGTADNGYNSLPGYSTFVFQEY
jgi:glycosidase